MPYIFHAVSAPNRDTRIELLELLLEAGCNFDERNVTCQNILTHAILTPDCDEKVLKYLFAKCKALNCEYMFHEKMRFESFGLKVLHKCLDWYVYFYGEPDEFERPLLFLLYKGMGVAPIHAAFVKGDMVAATMLINEGVDLFAKSACGMSAMDYAKLGHQEFVMEQFFDRILERRCFQVIGFILVSF